MSLLASLRTWIENEPGIPLLALVALTACCGVLALRRGIVQRRSLRGLASRWQMTYSRSDRLRITIQVAQALTFPGAADLYIYDVIWGRVGDVYRYLFTLEYTSGVLANRRRHRCVALFSENREATEPRAGLELAGGRESLLERYETLHSTLSGTERQPG